MAARKAPIDLAVVIEGGPPGRPGKGGASAPPSSAMAPFGAEQDPDMAELPPGFDVAFEEAFPEIGADPERMLAFKRLIHLCMESDERGEY